MPNRLHCNILSQASLSRAKCKELAKAIAQPMMNQAELIRVILVTASGKPRALEIKPMPNADGIGQTALDGIENEIFRGF